MLEVRLLMPPGTPLVVTEEKVTRVVEGLIRVDEQLSPLQPNGQTLVEHIVVEYNKNRDAFDSGAHLATVRADLLTVEDRNSRIDDIKALWRKEVGEIPGAVALSFKEPSFGPAGRAIEIRLQSESLTQLQVGSEAIRSALVKFDGVLDVMEDSRAGKEELQMQLKPGALSLGANGATIANQLRLAFNGRKIDDIQRGSEQIEVDLRLRPGR